MIDLLHHIRCTDNIYDLLLNEFYRVSSSESLDELSAVNPVFKVKLRTSEVKHLYKEYSDINLEKQQFTFILYCKKGDASLNIAFRASFPTKFSSNLKILSFLTVTEFEACPEIKQSSTRVVSSPKALNTIFNKSNFLNFFKDGNKCEIDIKVYLRVNIKTCCKSFAHRQD